MSHSIDQFCENLRSKLTDIDNKFNSLKAKMDSKAQAAGQDVQTQLSGLKQRIDQNHAKVAAAQADLKKWADERKAMTDQKVAEWKSKRENAKLQHRADGAESYAAAAADIALAAVDEAEQAALEAWQARADADGAQSIMPNSETFVFVGFVRQEERNMP